MAFDFQALANAPLISGPHHEMRRQKVDYLLWHDKLDETHPLSWALAIKSRVDDVRNTPPRTLLMEKGQADTLRHWRKFIQAMNALADAIIHRDECGDNPALFAQATSALRLARKRVGVEIIYFKKYFPELDAGELASYGAWREHFPTLLDHCIDAEQRIDATEVRHLIDAFRVEEEEAYRHARGIRPQPSQLELPYAPAEKPTAKIQTPAVNPRALPVVVPIVGGSAVPNPEGIALLALDPIVRMGFVHAVSVAITRLPTLDGSSSWYDKTLELVRSQPRTAALQRAKMELNRAIDAVAESAVPKNGEPANSAAMHQAFGQLEFSMLQLRNASTSVAAQQFPDEIALSGIKLLLPETIKLALASASQQAIDGRASRAPGSVQGGGPSYPLGRR